MLLLLIQPVDASDDAAARSVIVVVVVSLTKTRQVRLALQALQDIVGLYK